MDGLDEAGEAKVAMVNKRLFVEVEDWGGESENVPLPDAAGTQCNVTAVTGNTLHVYQEPPQAA